MGIGDYFRLFTAQRHRPQQSTWRMHVGFSYTSCWSQFLQNYKKRVKIRRSRIRHINSWIMSTSNSNILQLKCSRNWKNSFSLVFYEEYLPSHHNMAALLDLLSKARVNNSLVPVTVRHGRSKLLVVLRSLLENGIICVQQIPGDLFARLSCRLAPLAQVWLTAIPAVSQNPELTQSRGQLRCTVVGQWRHRVLIHQRLCPADHTVLQLTL